MQTGQTSTISSASQKTLAKTVATHKLTSSSPPQTATMPKLTGSFYFSYFSPLSTSPNDPESELKKAYSSLKKIPAAQSKKTVAKLLYITKLELINNNKASARQAIQKARLLVRSSNDASLTSKFQSTAAQLHENFTF